MSPRFLLSCWLLTVFGGGPTGVSPALGVNGVILDQQLTPSGHGYTVIRLWGSDYEMGYAHATLLGDAIVDGINEVKAILGGANYALARQIMADATWMPPEIENELDGMVDALAVTHPAANIDKLDLKVINTQGDWGYACRSHTCWGRYVADPIKTLSTRRLDYGTPFAVANHHVLCARKPTDGSVRWVNMAWPGFVTVASAVNEFGTIVSLHDYQSTTDFSAGTMSRMVAARHAVTYATSSNIATHLTDTYAELQTYEIMTGSFVNYYAPEGHGGVMVCNPYHTAPDFYYVRTPQAVWHHGEAMITTNAWTDGTYTPSDEDFGADAYYNDESAKTHESHWNLLANSGDGLHMLSVAYRGRGDMAVWADGRLDGIGRTPRLEWEWKQLFSCSADLDIDGDVDANDFLTFSNCFNGSLHPPSPICANPLADLDEDGDADVNDFLTFSSCFNGALHPPRCP